MRLSSGIRLILVGCCLTAVAPLWAKSIVADQQTLEPANEQHFDQAIVTITGPNGFYKQVQLNGNDTRMDIEAIGITADGDYQYEIQYANQGKQQEITDPTTGRVKAIRNLGSTKQENGHFRVFENQLVTVEEAISEKEMTGATNESNSFNDISNFEVVESSTQGQNNEK
ncbi:hypothetical protein [Shewanella sedimentimangrovi]|uniref:Uncharacterized protein n=1 Tax=Shewanella sedimentimangrovi TaxID=2814293 RepID=A0ABX7QXQ3_9GAMM|nr:hypothetical protein [Shewanella sedimentimangrovi]QSX36019.1 hypothetical protein JYB85_11795 [Shewanella sedimentimangrovi]